MLEWSDDADIHRFPRKQYLPLAMPEGAIGGIQDYIKPCTACSARLLHIKVCKRTDKIFLVAYVKVFTQTRSRTGGPWPIKCMHHVA